MESKVSGWVKNLFDQPDFADCFLLEVIFKPPKKIEIFVDADAGITLSRCQQISRALEAHLDADPNVPDNYLLEVSSGGVDRPLELPRQYPKHIGRKLSVELKSGENYVGKLEKVGEHNIQLAVTIKEKGKKKRSELMELAFDDINKSIVQISFK